MALGPLDIQEGDVVVGGVLPLDVQSQGGVLVPLSTLSIAGDFSGNIRFEFGAGDLPVVEGDGGVANVQTLAVELPSRYLPVDGTTFELLRGWDALSVRHTELPAIGNAAWDTSRIQEGVLSIRHDVRPCDFDESAYCDLTDLNALAAELIDGGDSLVFDVDGDGVVDRRDAEQWRIDAAKLNGFESAYLPGDRNLDGSVGAGDLTFLGRLWLRTVRNYSSGDFDFSGVVDAADLNIMALHWGQTIALSEPATVPEPEIPMRACLLLLCCCHRYCHVRKLLKNGPSNAAF